MNEAELQRLGLAMVEINKALGEYLPDLKNLKSLIKDVDDLHGRVRKQEKLSLSRMMGGGGERPRGGVTPDAARAFAAHLVLSLDRRGILTDALPGWAGMLPEARQVFNVEQRAALTTADIAMPIEYTQQLKELQAEYGVCRRVMTPYPIGRGTSKPARLGTQDDFTFPIAMSAPVSEKNVKLGNASLESHKGGGLLRLPRELDEQGIIPLGQMLARYAARKFAKSEDTIGFLGDGSGTYDNIKGVCQIASENNYITTLGASKTAPSDATLADFRSLRPLVATPVIGSGVYYIHNTFESRLRDFNSVNQPNVYVQVGPRGRATLDGYDIVWTEVLQPYVTTATASKYIAVFGDLSYWWFGEHGYPRTDMSSDVFFTTDEIAIRWLEEIDFDYAALDCAAVLKTAAA